MKLSDLIKRKRGKVSQAAFARQLGVTRAAVSLWEKGNTIPNAAMLEKLGISQSCTYSISKSAKVKS